MTKALVCLAVWATLGHGTLSNKTRKVLSWSPYLWRLLLAMYPLPYNVHTDRGEVIGKICSSYKCLLAPRYKNNPSIGSSGFWEDPFTALGMATSISMIGPF